MGIPLTPLLWFAALLPIALLMILLVLFRRGVPESSLIALTVASFCGVALFQAPLTLIAVEIGKGIWNAIAIVTVIFPAILIFEVTVAAGAIGAFRRELVRFSPNELMQVLAVGWVLVSFLQGVTGFGVPVAVGVPLLIGIGVKPVSAVVISLLGQAWGNTFGTLAIAWDALVFQAGLTDADMLRSAVQWSAVFTWLVDLSSGLAIAWLYGGFKATRKNFSAILMISTIHGGGQVLLSTVNPSIANFAPSCVALLAMIWIGRTPPYDKPYACLDSKVMSSGTCSSREGAEECMEMSISMALFPYLLLVALTLSVFAIPDLQNILGFWKIGISVPETVTGLGFVNKAIISYSPLTVFTHAGTFLLSAALAGWGLYLKKGFIQRSRNLNIIYSSLQKTLPSALAVFALVAMSKVMTGTGQIEVLARGIAEVVGVGYVLAAPFVGVTGSFITSSNLSSNIMFAFFQRDMAELLKIDPALLLAAQTAGGAIGSMIAPGKIILGTSTAGILGSEGQIIKQLLLFSLGLSALLGILVFAIHFSS